jgi:hypothetical protein
VVCGVNSRTLNEHNLQWRSGLNFVSWLLSALRLSRSTRNTFVYPINISIGLHYWIQIPSMGHKTSACISYFNRVIKGTLQFWQCKWRVENCHSRESWIRLRDSSRSMTLESWKSFCMIFYASLLFWWDWIMGVMLKINNDKNQSRTFIFLCTILSTGISWVNNIQFSKGFFPLPVFHKWKTNIFLG